MSSHREVITLHIPLHLQQRDPMAQTTASLHNAVGEMPVAGTMLIIKISATNLEPTGGRIKDSAVHGPPPTWEGVCLVGVKSRPTLTVWHSSKPDLDECARELGLHVS